jgi:hypothetical protein
MVLAGCGSSGPGSGLITQSWVQQQTASGGSFSSDAAQVNLDPAHGDCRGYDQFASDLASAISENSTTAQVAWHDATVLGGVGGEYVTEAIIPAPPALAQQVMSDAQQVPADCATRPFSGYSPQELDPRDAGSFDAGGKTGYTFTVSPQGKSGQSTYEATSMAYTGTDLIVVRDILAGGDPGPSLSEEAVSYSVGHS